MFVYKCLIYEGHGINPHFILYYYIYFMKENNDIFTLYITIYLCRELCAFKDFKMPSYILLSGCLILTLQQNQNEKEAEKKTHGKLKKCILKCFE